MTDPFDALREPASRVAPDPRFAERLRARLERALLDPRGTPMTAETSTSQAPISVTSSGPTQGDVSYASLWLPDVERAEAFYSAVLGWQVGPGREARGRRIDGVRPRMGMWGEVPHSTLFLAHAVDDVPATVERVRAAGGQADEPVEEPYGLAANCVDNQGQQFTVVQLPVAERAPAPAPRPGELVYLTMEAPDSARFREFYGAVFGWRFAPGRVADGWAIEEVRTMAGLAGGAERSTVVPMYGVADIRAAVDRVRANGGTSTEPEQQPYGTSANCTDDQGTRFYLGEL